MIGAHPDDCDYLSGGTAAKFARLGHVVRFVSLTNGNTGHHEMGGGQLARIRAREASNAGKTAKIEYEVLDINSNGIEADLKTREKVITLIREFKPDVVFTHRPYDYHPDHRITSMLVQDSSYAVVVPNVCPLTPSLKHKPMIMYFLDFFKKPYEFIADIVVDIDDTFEDKVRMLGCHKSQMYEWLPWVDGRLGEVPEEDEARLDWLKKEQQSVDGKTADRFRMQLIRKYGETKGSCIKAAEAFELCEYGRKPSEEELRELFPF